MAVGDLHADSKRAVDSGGSDRHIGESGLALVPSVTAGASLAVSGKAFDLGVPDGGVAEFLPVVSTWPVTGFETKVLRASPADSADAFNSGGLDIDTMEFVLASLSSSTTGASHAGLGGILRLEFSDREVVDSWLAMSSALDSNSPDIDVAESGLGSTESITAGASHGNKTADLDVHPDGEAAALAAAMVA